jgi:hypothetical protein
MILSLLVCLIFFVTVIVIVGSSPIGSQVIGKEGTATWQANATTWNIISAFGGLSIFLIIVIVIAAFLLIGAFQAASLGGMGDY